MTTTIEKTMKKAATVTTTNAPNLNAGAFCRQIRAHC